MERNFSERVKMIQFIPDFMLNMIDYIEGKFMSNPVAWVLFVVLFSAFAFTGKDTKKGKA